MQLWFSIVSTAPPLCIDPTTAVRTYVNISAAIVYSQRPQRGAAPQAPKSGRRCIRRRMPDKCNLLCPICQSKTPTVYAVYATCLRHIALLIWLRYTQRKVNRRARSVGLPKRQRHALLCTPACGGGRTHAPSLRLRACAQCGIDAKNLIGIVANQSLKSVDATKNFSYK